MLSSDFSCFAGIIVLAVLSGGTPLGIMLIRVSQNTPFSHFSQFYCTDICDLVLVCDCGMRSLEHLEECHLLGYKNSVHTSQERHYFSATEPNRLMLCKI
jgi:hypothetical protein